MRKPRRPRGLRDLGFQSYEFQLIGEIIVLCGLIERLLRKLPLYLIKADEPAAIAFTAHLNFLSLCDLNIAVINDVVTNKRERELLVENIKRANTLFDDRNRLVHGPFMLFEGDVRATARLTARREIRFQVHEYDRETLTTLLSNLGETYFDLESDVLRQKLEWYLRVREND